MHIKIIFSECIILGDTRANEQVAMSALHHLWHRYHNTLENRLQRLNPHWGGEKLFQETRRIVIAIWQHIVYNEYVPTVIGPREMDRYRLNLATEGHFDRTLLISVLINSTVSCFCFHPYLREFNVFMLFRLVFLKN